MFGSIGITEILVIAAIGLMVLGPEKFPEVARMFARLFKDVRGYMDEAKHEIAKEIKPLEQEIHTLKKTDTKKYLNTLLGEEDSATTENSEPPKPTMPTRHEDDENETDSAAEMGETVGLNNEPEEPELPNKVEYGIPAPSDGDDDSEVVTDDESEELPKIPEV